MTNLDDFKALDPFFRIIEKGLEGIADGGHFFGLLAEDVVLEYVITVPGYPRRVEGRKDGHHVDGRRGRPRALSSRVHVCPLLSHSGQPATRENHAYFQPLPFTSELVLLIRCDLTGIFRTGSDPQI